MNPDEREVPGVEDSKMSRRSEDGQYYRHRTGFYEVVIASSPARLLSLKVDPSGCGQYLGIISNFGPKGSAPFASYGSRLKWHEDRCFEAGQARTVVRDHNIYELQSIPVGPHGLELTWRFDFEETEFAMTLTWKARTAQRGLWEAGWKLDSFASNIGHDQGGMWAGRGYGGPFRARGGAWMSWWERDPRYEHTLVAALVPGTADRGDAIYVEVADERPVTWGAWLTISRPGGVALSEGTVIRGGRWRFGASGSGADGQFVDAFVGRQEKVVNHITSTAEVVSDRKAAREWARGYDDKLSHEDRVASRCEDGSYILVGGSVMAALVLTEDGTFRARFYVKGDDDWQLVACAMPTKRFLTVELDEPAVGLLITAENADLQGSGVTTSRERWTVERDPPRVHIESVDTVQSARDHHTLHAYVAYPGGRSKFELPEGYDCVAGPHLRPRADLVVGQHTMRSPVAGVQHETTFVALVPDLRFHRKHEMHGTEDGPRHFGLCMDVDVANRLVDGAVISFGWRFMEWAYSLWKVEEGYFCRALDDAAPKAEVCLAYDLLIRTGASPQGVIGECQRWLWSNVGTRYFRQSTLPQTQPSDAMFDDAWRWGERLYEACEWEGRAVGAIRADREFPPDAMFTSWFNALRTAYGVASFGRYRQDRALEAVGRSTLSLLLSAPNESGAFPTIVRFAPSGLEWFGSHRNFANQMPWGPTSYNTFDMSWTAYWLLRWHQDLGPQPEAVAFAVKYGEFLLRVQDQNGAIPSWLTMADLSPDPHLRQSAQTASSLLFLAELAHVTGMPTFLRAAVTAGEYTVSQHTDRQRWDDFEVFYSNAPKAEGATDPISGMSAQDSLSMHFAAAGLLRLWQLTGQQHWLGDGQRALDQLLQYQAVWPATFLSLYTFGGFSVQNTDQEWNDARQSQIAPTLLEYARATGHAEYAERGIAALRASFATMCTPSAEVINPRYFDYQERGWANENYAHNPYDAPTTPVPTPHFDWGVGSGLAGFAEARNRFGQVWVDLAHRVAYGIDDVSVEVVDGSSGGIGLTVESRSPSHRVRVRIEGAEPEGAELTVNGVKLLMSPEGGWAELVVPATYRGRIVHNVCRGPVALGGHGVLIEASIDSTVVVRNATLFYRRADCHWQSVELVSADAGQYRASVPSEAVRVGSAIEYYLEMETDGGFVTSPEVDPKEVPFRQVVG